MSQRAIEAAAIALRLRTLLRSPASMSSMSSKFPESSPSSQPMSDAALLAAGQRGDSEALIGLI